MLSMHTRYYRDCSAMVLIIGAVGALAVLAQSHAAPAPIGVAVVHIYHALILRVPQTQTEVNHFTPQLPVPRHSTGLH